MDQEDMLNEFEWSSGDRETILNYYKLPLFTVRAMYERGKKFKGWRKNWWVNNWVDMAMAKGNIVIGANWDFSPENDGTTKKRRRIVEGTCFENKDVSFLK